MKNDLKNDYIVVPIISLKSIVVISQLHNNKYIDINNINSR